MTDTGVPPINDPQFLTPTALHLSKALLDLGVQALGLVGTSQRGGRDNLGSPWTNGNGFR